MITASLRRDMVAVTAARFLVPLFNASLVVAIARLQGPAGLGEYTFFLTVFLLLEQLKSCGLPSLLIRECAGKPAAMQLVWWRSLVRFGIAGGLLLFPVMLAASFAERPTPLSVAVLFGIALVPSAFCLSTDAVFLASGQPQLTVWIALIEGLVRVAASLTVVWFKGGLVGLAAVYVLTRTLAAVIGTQLVYRRLGRFIDSEWEPEVRQQLRREAAKFFAVFILPLALYRMDVISLGYFSSPRELGVYSAAFRFFSLALVLPDGVLGAAFATYSKHHSQNDSRALRDTAGMVLSRLAAVLVAVALLGNYLGGPVTSLVYGSAFRDSVPVLCILLWTLPLFALNRALGDAIIATGYESVIAKIVIAALLISGVAYPLLTKTYGAIGTAWALMAVSGFIGLLTLGFGSRHAFIPSRRAVSVVLSVLAGLGAGLSHSVPLRWIESTISLILVGLTFVRPSAPRTTVLYSHHEIGQEVL